MTAAIVGGRGPDVLFRHYRGGRYVFVLIAETDEHNGDHDVVYVSLTHGKYVTRPLVRDSRNRESWLDLVLWPDGQTRHRFCPETPELAGMFVPGWKPADTWQCKRCGSLNPTTVTVHCGHCRFL